MEETEEIWKPVVGYEDLYDVSNLGRVKSLGREMDRKSKGVYFSDDRILKPFTSNNRRVRVRLSKKGKQMNYNIHRLVAFAFIPNPDYIKDKLEINHIDGDPTNNKVSNLEWVTRSQNSMHAWKMGLNKKKIGKDHHRSIPINCFKLNGEFVKRYESISLVALDGFDIGYVHRIIHGKRKTYKGFTFGRA
jgi:hypothetical protein